MLIENLEDSAQSHKAETSVLRNNIKRLSVVIGYEEGKYLLSCLFGINYVKCTLSGGELW